MNITYDLLWLIFVYIIFYVCNGGTKDLGGSQKLIGYYIKVPKIILRLLFYYPKLWLNKDDKIVIHVLIYQVFLQLFTMYCVAMMLIFQNKANEILYFYWDISLAALLLPIAGKFIGMFLYSRKYNTEDVSKDEINKKSDGRD